MRRFDPSPSSSCSPMSRRAGDVAPPTGSGAAGLRTRASQLGEARRAVYEAIPRSQFTADDLAAHRAWLARGGSGEGRLRSRGGLIRGPAFAGIDLGGAQLYGPRMNGAELR